MKTVNKLFESVHRGSWVFKSIKQTRNGQRYIIEGKTRFFQGFEQQNSFYKIVSKKYADKLSIEYFGKKTSELNCFIY